MYSKTKTSQPIYLKSFTPKRGSLEVLVEEFYAEEKKLNEERNTYLAFARELAEVWKVLLPLEGAADLIKAQEVLIADEVHRAWSGHVTFDRPSQKVFAHSADGIAMELLSGESFSNEKEGA